MKHCLHITLFLLLLVAAVPAAERAAGYVLVVNRNNPVNSITAQEANLIFLGKKTVWPGGHSVTIVLQEGKRIHAAFVRELLGRSPQQYATYWKKALFTGTAIPPRFLRGDSEVKSFVASNRDAVGYISPDALDTSVRVLEVRK